MMELMFAKNAGVVNMKINIPEEIKKVEEEIATMEGCIAVYTKGTLSSIMAYDKIRSLKQRKALLKILGELEILKEVDSKLHLASEKKILKIAKEGLGDE